MEHNKERHHAKKTFSKGAIIACIVLAVVGILLLTGHKAHLYGFLPFLLILACPLIHIFMHGGHNHNTEKDDNAQKGTDEHKHKNH